MTVTVGPVVLDYVTVVDGGTTTGAFAATKEAGTITRDNLLAMRGTIQPVAWAEAPDLDGFHRIVDASATYWGDDSWDFTIVVDPLPQKRSAQVEMISVGAERAGAPGPATGTPWLAVPDSALSWEHDGGDTREAVGGAVKLRASTSSPDLFNIASVWTTNPEDYRGAAPTVTVDGTEVFGRSDHLDFADVEISNGILSLSKGATWMFAVQSIDLTTGPNYTYGSSYEVSVGYRDPVGAAWDDLDPGDVDQVQVWVPGPHVATMRLVTHFGRFPLTIDVWLRRGACVAEMLVNYVAADWEWGLKIPGSSFQAMPYNGIRTGTIQGVERCALVHDSADRSGQASGEVNIDAAAAKARLGYGVILSPGGNTTPNGRAPVENQFYAGQAVSESIARVRA